MTHRPHHPHLQAQARLATPMGTMTAAASASGLAGLWFDGQAHHPGPLAAPVDPDQRWLRAAEQALAAYFDGAANPLQGVALDLHGTAFQQAVWRALQALPRGRTSTYASIAAAAGSPAAVRAAGAAIGRNPVSILVPCHRVLGRDGSLTGYAGGLERKQALLQREGVLLT
ncbi:MAG: methylated-DNA--[protein]-cysteine S-methyltransferase [Aquabacterium sp.]|nr:methylated-DNA--[protein]-cysteine S-methyltransferase [Aquabacterium sp.]